MIITPSPPKKKRQQKTYRTLYFAVAADHRMKIKENENQEKYFDFARETVMVIVISLLRKETGRFGNRGTNRDHPNYNNVEIDQNTEKSPGDMRRLAVSQSPVKDSQLTLA